MRSEIWCDDGFVRRLGRGYINIGVSWSDVKQFISRVGVFLSQNDILAVRKEPLGIRIPTRASCAVAHLHHRRSLAVASSNWPRLDLEFVAHLYAQSLSSSWNREWADASRSAACNHRWAGSALNV